MTYLDSRVGRGDGEVGDSGEAGGDHRDLVVRDLDKGGGASVEDGEVVGVRSGDVGEGQADRVSGANDLLLEGEVGVGSQAGGEGGVARGARGD